MKVFKMLMLMMVFSIVLFLFVGCTTASTPLSNSLYQTLTQEDLKIYAEAMGELGYYLCSYYANDPKHADKIERLKTIYAAIDRAKKEGGREGLDLAALNDATAEIVALLASSQLGPAYGPMAKVGTKALLITGYNYYKSRIKNDNLEVILESAWNGVEKAKASGADFIAAPTDIDELIAMEPSEECGLQCILDKIRSRLDAGGLTAYDKKRLKKRKDELEKILKQIEAEVAAEKAAEKAKQ